jgi:hypothetical protein
VIAKNEKKKGLACSSRRSLLAVVGGVRNAPTADLSLRMRFRLVVRGATE